MKKGYEKDRLELRGELYYGLACYLGVQKKRRESFIFKVEKKLGIKERSLINWKQRGFPAKEAFDFETLWTAAEDTVNEFITDANIPAEEREAVLKNWMERGDAIRKGIEATFFNPADLGKESAERVLKSMGEAAQTLPPLFAYKLFINFDGYTAITAKDFRLITGLILGTDKERRQISKTIAAAEMRPASEIIEGLMSAEGKQWWEIRNNDYEHNFKNGKNPSRDSWTLFQEKALSLSGDKLFALLAVVALIWPDDNGSAPLGVEAIDQLLAFKYCLTEEAQDEVLEMWA